MVRLRLPGAAGRSGICPLSTSQEGERRIAPRVAVGNVDYSGGKSLAGHMHAYMSRNSIHRQ